MNSLSWYGHGLCQFSRFYSSISQNHITDFFEIFGVTAVFVHRAQPLLSHPLRRNTELNWLKIGFGFKNWIKLPFQQSSSEKAIWSLHSEDILWCPGSFYSRDNPFLISCVNGYTIGTTALHWGKTYITFAQVVPNHVSNNISFRLIKMKWPEYIELGS